MSNAQSKNYDVSTRLQGLTLQEADIAVKIITVITELFRHIIIRLNKQTRERGYKLKIFTQLLLKYVINKSRSNRSLIVTFIIKAVKKCDGRLVSSSSS